MKKLSFFVGILILLSSCNAQLGNILSEIGGGELTNAEVASGLKEALSKGTTNGSEALSKRDAFYTSAYKILLPDDAKKVCDKLRIIPGFDKLEENMVKKVNHAAEDAAIKAKPIFLNAIKQLTFTDVWNILTGADNAATSFLQRTTTEPLFNEFKPVITNALNQQGALDLWSSAVTKYNAIPLVKKANPDVAAHVTNKALEGLFKKIAEEELDIRHNLASRTTDLLKKVFARQDKK
ncbi:MAG: DUF4197 domain-containing protein [Saprospiraceae bacterium]|nr:DUF4197 domain-containing protein [Saprospiraceae bacterium]